MALPLYTLTLFLSAFVLFLVQPMISKMILPRLGGTPQVWNTCMVFFQMVLLAGYAYTHTSSTKLKLRGQLIIHCILLFVPFLVLLLPVAMGTYLRPFDVSSFIPPPGVNPIPATLFLLAVVVGLPFFVVSTSAPLLQRWFAYTGHPSAKDPYFLYGASNLGSMLALLLYPVLVEPLLLLNQQAWTWTIGYGLLVLTILLCAAMIWRASGQVSSAASHAVEPEPASEGVLAPPAVENKPEAPVVTTAVTAQPPASRTTGIRKGQPKYTADSEDAPSIRRGEDEITWGRRLRWIGLAAIPSSLMLGVTNHITTDLSPIPLFWIIPLALYLLTFILVFARWPVRWVEAPHTFVLYAQPIAIALMLFMELIAQLNNSPVSFHVPLVFDVLAFFLTALACHGEMAKDRPSARHLTEFYLMMSVGGMLGGVFNALLAPLLFPKLWEYSIAVAVACFLRPQMKVGGWSDDLVATFVEESPAPVQAPRPAKTGKGTGKPAAPRSAPRVSAGASEGLSRIMDWALPIALAIFAFLLVALRNMLTGFAERFVSARSGRDDVTVLAYFFMFGIPLIISCFYYARPIRYGLAVMFLMLISGQGDFGSGENSLLSDRSYFGIITVRKSFETRTVANAQEHLPYKTLIHGHITHGMNFYKPDNQDEWGHADKDFSRLASTYYHRLGPVGVVMEKFNWFHDAPNTYGSDARMPASLVGQVTAALGVGTLPIGEFGALWSEPPYATIGLGTGTMASYGRPFQAVDYYEIDNHIRRLSLPTGKEGYYTKATLEDIEQNEPGRVTTTFFSYLGDAVKRGSEVNVRMGDARLRMAREYKNIHEYPDDGGGPDGFYHMMVVDAFSSDAIPAHLLTVEAFKMYFTKLSEEGILCVHTSNRYVELPKVVADVANHLGYAYLTGHDQAPQGDMGHFTSEWVMVARKPAYLKTTPDGEWPGHENTGTGPFLTPPGGHWSGLVAPADYVDQLRSKRNVSQEQYWERKPLPENRFVWTDDYSNLWAVIR